MCTEQLLDIRVDLEKMQRDRAKTEQNQTKWQELEEQQKDQKNQWNEVVHKLSTILLGDGDDFLGSSNRIIFFPTGNLWRVPFGSLKHAGMFIHKYYRIY